MGLFLPRVFAGEEKGVGMEVGQLGSSFYFYFWCFILISFNN